MDQISFFLPSSTQYQKRQNRPVVSKSAIPYTSAVSHSSHISKDSKTSLILFTDTTVKEREPKSDLIRKSSKLFLIPLLAGSRPNCVEDLLCLLYIPCTFLHSSNFFRHEHLIVISRRIFATVLGLAGSTLKRKTTRQYTHYPWLILFNLTNEQKNTRNSFYNQRRHNWPLSKTNSNARKRYWFPGEICILVVKVNGILLLSDENIMVHL